MINVEEGNEKTEIIREVLRFPSLHIICYEHGSISTFVTLSGQGDTRPKYRLLAAGGVNVNRRTSSTPHSVALPATKIRHLGSEGVLRHRFVILQGTGTKRTGRTLSDSNAAESQICGAKPCVPLSTEGNSGAVVKQQKYGIMKIKAG